MSDERETDRDRQTDKLEKHQKRKEADKQCERQTVKDTQGEAGEPAGTWILVAP